jgi:hypothetical protein
VVYLNDILIYSDTPEEHTKNVREVFRHLREQGLYCKLSKCEFSITTCEYLGYILSSDGLKMLSEKVKAIQDWPVPQKVKDIQSFLGFCNFYRHFIPSYSNITIPLTCLIQKPSGFGRKRLRTHLIHLKRLSELRQFYIIGNLINRSQLKLMHQTMPLHLFFLSLLRMVKFTQSLFAAIHLLLLN